MTDFTHREWDLMTQTRGYSVMLYALETFRKELESNTFNDAELYDDVNVLRDAVEVLHYKVQEQYSKDLDEIRENRYSAANASYWR